MRIAKTALIALTALVLVAGAALAQDGEEMSNEEIVEQLARINEKLDRVIPSESEKDDDDGAAFGGGPFYATRYLLEIDELNTYLDARGDYDDFKPFFIPFADGGGGTWRLTLQNGLQFGAEFWGYGQSRLGLRTHQDPAVNDDLANDTIDEDGDGFDDYYTYAEYGIGLASATVGYKLGFGDAPLAGLLTLRGGFGGDTFAITQNKRNVITAALQIDTPTVLWQRSLAGVGGSLALQLNPPDFSAEMESDMDEDGDDRDRHRVTGLLIEFGFDYFFSLAGRSNEVWEPTLGVHHLDPVPPTDYNPMNAWVNIVPTFNY
jgi:hypothetical protein